ncbi:EEF1A lysine methyltransferase 4-like [Hibiscus syriacus]|uniref:EEF1A lysine methyltransferase 4-like n=1 Tax=Hibiscus syriacus TaxID=106335 RepID=UPI0019216225|nr:EEF1A lysine methyltransferase 4-like [Hibiscus syriacus]
MTIGTPPSSQAYGEPWYWDNRYANESAPFDWYQKYPSLTPLIRHYVPLRHHRVLVVGCGNSVFSEEMVNDGYGDVVNVDISSVVIDAMQFKYSNWQQLKYIKLDVRDMSPFQSGSFDAVIDKGTLDSILCGNNSRQNAAQMLDEIWRVLKDKGVYILITYGAPVYRPALLKESCVWSIKLHVIAKFGPEGSSEQQARELKNPIPLDESGSSVEDVLGKNPDVHYIYVCTKEPKTAKE